MTPNGPEKPEHLPMLLPPGGPGPAEKSLLARLLRYRFFLVALIIILFFAALFAWHGLPLGAKFAFSLRRMSQRDLVDELAGLAEIARKQGPIGLEKVEIEDPFLAKGIRYVADGYDTAFIRDNLERDRDNFLTHLDEGQKIYRAIGDCAPAFGMIGTLIGMVQMFANMTDPSKLGPFMAVALLATFYGAAVANLLCLPIADKLHLKLVDEEINRTLIIDGILMIREAKSPTLVREMLLAYLPEKHRHNEAEEVKEAEAVAA